LFLYYGDLVAAGELSHPIYNVQPDEVYHLGAQSHVMVSFDNPEYTGQTTGLGTTRILDAIRKSGIKARFYQASSSEMFGAAPPPQNEETKFHTRSRHGAAKVYGYWMAVNFREAYGLYACIYTGSFLPYSTARLAAVVSPSGVHTRSPWAE
jgi:GDPmannose 4,6-dehydratase